MTAEHFWYNQFKRKDLDFCMYAEQQFEEQRRTRNWEIKAFLSWFRDNFNDIDLSWQVHQDWLSHYEEVVGGGCGGCGCGGGGSEGWEPGEWC